MVVPVSVNCQFDVAQSHLKRESQLRDVPNQTGLRACLGGGGGSGGWWGVLIVN